MSTPEPSRRRSRAAVRSLTIASVAAFAGGTAVVAVQFGLGLVSAGYPPVVQALTCSARESEDGGEVALLAQEGQVTPIAEFPVGGRVSCRIDAPGADYATWSIIGPTTVMRSGPLNAAQPCQTPEDFSAQDPSLLTLSACQSFVPRRPGLYLLSVTVMLRGLEAVDRMRMLVRIVPAPADTPATPAQRHERLSVTLRLPAAEAEDLRSTDLSASFGEHGLLPQSRTFQRTVYRLAADEAFVSAAFRVRSASNASAVTLAYDPQSRSVTARYTLRSGPLVDRWRGWVTGTVEVRVRRGRAAQDIALPDVELPIPGRTELALPEGVDTAEARILLRRPESSAVVEVLPGSSALVDGARITAMLSEGLVILTGAPE